MGLATVLILAGVIVDDYGYLMLEMFFLGCLFGKHFDSYEVVILKCNFCVLANLMLDWLILE